MGKAEDGKNAIEKNSKYLNDVDNFFTVIVFGDDLKSIEKLKSTHSFSREFDELKNCKRIYVISI